MDAGGASPWMGEGRIMQEQLSRAMQEQLPRCARTAHVQGAAISRYKSVETSIAIIRYSDQRILIKQLITGQ